MSTKSDITQFLFTQENEWRTASQIVNALPNLHGQTLYASLSLLTKSGFLESGSHEGQKKYRLAASAIESLKSPPKVRKTKVFWTQGEKDKICRVIETLSHSMPNQHVHVLLNIAQEAVLPPERRQAKKVSSVNMGWIKDRIKQLKALGAAVESPPESAPEAVEAPPEPPKAVEQPVVPPEVVEPPKAVEPPVVEGPPVISEGAKLSDESVKKLSTLMKQHNKAMRPTIVMEPTQNKPAVIGDFTTGQIIDEMLGRAGKSLKAGILDIIGSPQVAALVKSFFENKPVAGPPPTPPLEQQIEEYIQPPLVIPKFKGAGPYVPVQPAPSERRHNPFPPKGTSKPRLKKLLIVGLLKPTHVEEVRKAYQDKFDVRFHHPDSSDVALRQVLPGMDKVIVMTEQVSHKHINILKAAGCKYDVQTGSIGRLMANLAQLTIQTEGVKDEQ